MIMVKELNRLLLLLALICVFIYSNAADFSSGGLLFNYTSGQYGSSVYVVGLSSASGSGIVLEIPTTVTHGSRHYDVVGIGDNAFRGTDLLEIYKNGSDLKYIGANAFYGCSNLKKVQIKMKSPPTIESNTFMASTYEKAVLCVPISYLCDYMDDPNWGRFTSIFNIGSFCYGGKYYYVLEDNTAAVSPKYLDGIKYFGDIIIPETVKNPDNNNTLTVTSVGPYAFHYCSGVNWGLTSVTLPSTITTISEHAFNYCTALTSISLPGSLLQIDKYAFNNCSSLTSISIPNSTIKISEYTFNGCTSLSNVNLPNNLQEICDYAFNNCSSLTGIILPISLSNIANGSFYGCASLAAIDIPNSVSYIGENAFFGCSSLNSISIPNSVHSIGINAFQNCSNLKNLTIGNSVETIGSKAYYGCSSLSNILCKANIPPEIDQNTFSESTYSQALLRVPATSINQYRTANNWKKFFNIMVDGVLATSVSLDVSYASLYRNESLSLNATILPSNAVYKAVTWTSSDPSVATVSSSGLVTAKSLGNTRIIVKTDDGSNLSDTCYLVVKQRMATSISLNKSSANLYTNETLQLSATVLPSNADDKTVTWSSSNPNVATVSSSGLVTSISAGNAVITARTADGSNLSATCSIIVKQLATSISLNGTSATIYTGNTLQLNATVLPSTTSNPSVTWTSSNTSIATVSSTGLVTAKSTGDVVITAKTTDGSNLSATCSITVKQLATSISLNETSATIYTGNTLQLNATVLPSTTSNSTVTWTSSNTSVATVSSTGLVTAKSTGDAVITAKTTDGSNLSASCSVTVKRLATSISLNQTSATLYLNQTIQLTATVSPYNATDKSVVWSSFDSSIATVSENGLVTAIAPGYTTITATTVDGSNLSASCGITVKAYVTSLTLDQSEVTILEGDTITLTPTILPGYATNQSLNWSSSNTSVVSVNNGVVVGRSGGEATVTARTADGSNLSATCNVTVVPNFDITMPNLSHVRGSSNNRFDLTIDLANRYDITGMQFDMQLPDGVTIAEDGYGEYDIVLDDARKTRNHTATANSLGNNTYRILVSSATANALKGHYGTVLHMMVEVPVYHVSGNKQVKYTNIVLSEPDETRHTLPTKYDAANVDHNSTVDVNDLTGITNIALGRREGGILQMPAIQQTAEDDIELSAKPLEIQKGQTKTLELCLNENFAFAGYQMDIQLPEGLRLVDASLADGDSGLSIATAELPDGSIRLLASSFSLKDLAVNNSSFLRITLSAEDEIGADGRIILNGIKFSKRNMALHTVDHYEIPVGNGVSSLEQVYSRTRIYPEGKSIIIDSPESGTARIVTIAGISLSHDVQPGHNVIPMDDAGLYIVTLNGTTAKLYLK